MQASTTRHISVVTAAANDFCRYSTSLGVSAMEDVMQVSRKTVKHGLNPIDYVFMITFIS